MNKLLSVLLLGALAVLVVTIKIAFKPSTDVAVHAQGDLAVPGDLAKRATGVSGDYDDASETLRTMSELQKRTYEESEKDRAANQALRDSMDERIAAGVSETLSAELSSLKELFDEQSEQAATKYESQIAALQAKVDEAKAIAENALTDMSVRTPSDVPSNQVSLLQTESGSDFGFDDLALNMEQSASVRDNSAYTSIRPVGVSGLLPDGVDGGGLLDAVPNPLNMNGVIGETVSGVSNTLNGRGDARDTKNSRRATSNSRGTNGTPGEPMYTINDGATLFANTTMTALMGKVPFGNKVTDPYRFKIVTGGENLAASSKYIAKAIEEVIWTGYTAGNAEQSCVRGYLDTVTLIFEDGTISTTTTKKQTSRDTNETAYLGYITDEWGKPCIRGTYYDNGSQYLRNRTGIAALAATAEGISQVQTEVTRDSNGERTASVSGDFGAYVGGQALSGAARETLDYVRERSLNALDLVYVPTGTPVTMHVEAQIEFNYDPDGRRLSHVSTGVANAYLD